MNRRGLPPIKRLSQGLGEQRGVLRQLTREEAYSRRNAPLDAGYDDALNPLSQKVVEELEAERVAGSPSPARFRLPRGWNLKRVERQILAKDNFYTGSCKKPGGRKLRPNLRSLKEVYECLYTDRKRKTAFCRGSPDYNPGCLEGGGQAPIELALPGEDFFRNSPQLPPIEPQAADDAVPPNDLLDLVSLFPNNYEPDLEPLGLSPVQRENLEEAFSGIREIQDAVDNDLPVSEDYLAFMYQLLGNL
jgi:hypothetical protein